MNIRMHMVYWKSDEFWLGKLLEHPEIMTQGKTLEELEENIRDAYLMMVMDEVTIVIASSNPLFEGRSDGGSVALAGSWTPQTR